MPARFSYVGMSLSSVLFAFTIRFAPHLHVSSALVFMIITYPGRCLRSWLA